MNDIPRPPHSKEIMILIELYKIHMNKDVAPSIRELGGPILASTSMTTYYMNSLQRQGFIFRKRRIARSTRITDEGIEFLKANNYVQFLDMPQGFEVPD